MKIFICFFTCLSAVGGIQTEERTFPKIAIIGGGIGGTSCAYFLKSIISNVSIDLYEAEKIGGRLSVVDFADKKFEEGGSIIHSRNRYMVEFVKQFGLKKKLPPCGTFGLYNGKEFVFSESTWTIVTLWRMIERYGIGFWKLRVLIEIMLRKFERIYKLQKQGKAYKTVGGLLGAMDPKFVEYLKTSTSEGFEKQGVPKIVIDEIIMATIKANYGQDLSIQKMVGSVSVAGAVGNMWAVHGGNYQVAEKLLEASEAKLIIGTVTKLKRIPSGEIEVKVKVEGDPVEKTDLYDIVVIATPQTKDQKYKIKFQHFKKRIRFPGRYHKTVCTLVEGLLCDFYFPDKNAAIDEILSTQNAEFNSIGKVKSVDYMRKYRSYRSSEDLPVWKIFSQRAMNEKQMSELFEKKEGVHVKEWLAYPHYDHTFRNDTFVLDQNLYHINAIEWAASAMEMSVIGAKNVALLIHKNFECGRKIKESWCLSSSHSSSSSSEDENDEL